MPWQFSFIVMGNDNLLHQNYLWWWRRWVEHKVPMTILHTLILIEELFKKTGRLQFSASANHDHHHHHQEQE